MSELEIQNLAVSFKTGQDTVKAVRNINLTLNKGETLAIVGESGSGKSVTAKSVLGILSANAFVESGKILFDGKDLLSLSESELCKIRGKRITMVFQDPMSSLDPIVKVGPQLTEAAILNGRANRRGALKRVRAGLAAVKKQCKTLENSAELLKEFALFKKQIRAGCRQFSRLFCASPEKEFNLSNIDALPDFFVREKIPAGIKKILGQEGQRCLLGDAVQSVYKITAKKAYFRAISIMKEVGIPEAEKRFSQYPFEFSGGMRQRIVIAIAVAANPEVLVCDEPTTALDVTIQAQILELIKKLKRERNMSVIFITHDLGVVANVADRIAVMYAGKIVEYGTTEDIFYHPAHPYTWALLSSVPDLESKGRLLSIPGTPPDMRNPPAGDAFAARNAYALKIDFECEPPMFKISDTHGAATWLLHPDAPKVQMPQIISDRIARMKEARHAE